MSPELPPPDPNESSGIEPSQPRAVPREAVMFVHGSPSAETARLSRAVLRARPGVLIVVDPG